MSVEIKTTLSLLLTYCVLVICITACTYENSTDRDTYEIISVINDIYLDEESAVYHEAIPLDVLDQYINLPMTFNQLTVLLPPPEGLDTLFNEEIMSFFSTQLIHYKPLQFDQDGFNDLKTVKDSEIPDYIKDGYRPPAPYEEVTITNLYYLSTPLIYKDKAIVFSRNGPHYSLNVSFFVKNEKWERIAANAPSPK